ncbi:hypothetical protein [Bacteroides sp. 519]|uniref:hypothetical protein n=1 Tax=Bacteroides sp. 519 TaxID=2302937 RepID=UPI0013D697A7|nr:hypothetical protein [Bacteroides sp. 519]NDV58958.1 hypothetical protein [Bacteroides sp. 519]
MKKEFLILILISIITCDLFSQVIIKKESYVILSFERQQKGMDKEYYYWIVLIDSLKGNLNFEVFPICLSTNLNYNLKRCANADSISFWDNFIDNPKSYIGKIDSIPILDSFFSITENKKIKLKTISIKWKKEKNRRNETVDIYATPVIGGLCKAFGEYSFGESGFIEFCGNTFLPTSEITFIEDFWETINGRIIKYADYSIVDFTKYTPSIYQDRKRVQVVAK